MSNAVYPALPGLTFPVRKTPMFNTLMQESASGRENRIALFSYPKWKFQLHYSVLRSGIVHPGGATYAELQQLIDFFLARLGDQDSFLFDDKTDDAVTDFQFGTGDGVTTAFQLLRSINTAGFLEPVMNVNVLTNIKKNGVAQTNPTDYGINTTGLVTFTSAPAAAATLTWTGSYYYRARFMQSTQDFEQFMRYLWQGQVQLMTSLGVKV